MNSRLTIQTFLRNVSNSTVEAVVVVLVGGLPLILPFFGRSSTKSVQYAKHLMGMMMTMMVILIDFKANKQPYNTAHSGAHHQTHPRHCSSYF